MQIYSRNLISFSFFFKFNVKEKKKENEEVKTWNELRQTYYFLTFAVFLFHFGHEIDRDFFSFPSKSIFCNHMCECSSQD